MKDEEDITLSIKQEGTRRFFRAAPTARKERPSPRSAFHGKGPEGSGLEGEPWNTVPGEKKKGAESTKPPFLL